MARKRQTVGAVARRRRAAASGYGQEFNELCPPMVLLSIIQTGCTPAALRRQSSIPRAGDYRCGQELGDSGADLYKVEMPLYGKGARVPRLLTASQRLNGRNIPWVILLFRCGRKLLFPRAVRVAMEAGASSSGGTRGRSSVIGLPDTELMLRR